MLDNSPYPGIWDYWLSCWSAGVGLPMTIERFSFTAQDFEDPGWFVRTVCRFDAWSANRAFHFASDDLRSVLAQSFSPTVTAP